ncbi:preprotein translocase subunit SecY [Erysipelothrix inopinata]|uniref:Protein translocase subunit SecY n=1 Tax=Erysipelothrix inopinata TaxID=225084 RepID=A0A7G9RWH1_9FIRM|nr:preprotein translocase subunit SecY [Erysipelothrix inopinata]QNN59946.1 preprotein translocase subunit SecY [Erysipelothrix inopinata]
MRLFTDLFKNKEIRVRIIFTLAMLLVYRLGTVIPVPNVDSVKLAGMAASLESNSLVGMMNILGGGMLQSLSIFALGVGPYITASIIIQLLSMDVIPYLTELSKSGQKGKMQLDKITRYLGVVLAYVQAIGMVSIFQNQYSILLSSTPADYFFMGTIMAAGTMFLLWLGDQITQKGVGNGLSLIIFAGIVSSLPKTFIDTWSTMTVAKDVAGYLWFALFVVSYIAIIVLVIFMNNAVRKISIQYTSNVAGAGRGKSMNHLPLMINSASVIPVIFAGAIMNAPIIALSWFNQGSVYQFLNKWLSLQNGGPVALTVYALLIIAFTFFYTNLQVDPEKLAEDFGKNGSYIPGVRPGKDTKNYISTILNRITVLGALFLTFIALLPHIMPIITFGNIPSSTALGGTGIIIVVGVALETVKELEGRLTQRSYTAYKGLFNR